jgi:5,6-dimethylbenzimidazole synthase
LNQFSPAEIAAVYRAIAERRDSRHFLPDPVAPEVLHRLLQAAHQAPSVGFMQPWRFLRITDPALRATLHGLVEQERQRTAEALDERGREFLKLKVEGLRECSEVLVVALMPEREAHVFGRRTLPEMDLASVACAIQNMWLAARAEGLGMGWVSIFDPEQVRLALQMPVGSQPVAILCLGHVAEFYPRPLLESAGWASRAELDALVFENCWPAATPRPA